MLKLKRFFSLIIIGLCIACVKKRVNKYDSSLPHTKEPNSAFKLVDPENAKVEVDNLTVSTEAFQENYRLPSFKMTFGENDFVKILRCQSNYREYLEDSLGQSSNGKMSTRKWVWVDSFGDTKHCKVASNRFNSTEYQDLGAKNGSFFYLINPCVSASISITGKDECSYHLKITNNLVYKESPSSQVLHQSMELADAESAYDAIISKLLGLSRSILNERERCEQAANKALSQKNANTFAWDLISIGIAAGAAFGARAVISKRNFDLAADYVKEYKVVSKSESFLRSVGNASNFNKNLFTAGFFASALGLSTLIRGLKSKNIDTTEYQACQKAEELSQEVLKIQDEKQLEQAMNEIIRVSSEISQLDKTFNAYGTSSFNMPN